MSAYICRSEIYTDIVRAAGLTGVRAEHAIMVLGFVNMLGVYAHYSGRIPGSTLAEEEARVESLGMTDGQRLPCWKLLEICREYVYQSCDYHGWDAPECFARLLVERVIAFAEYEVKAAREQKTHEFLRSFYR